MFSVRVDTKAFNAALDEYMATSKRMPADIINSKLFFIARNATATTHATTKEKVENELRGPSKVNQDVPVAAAIINSQYGKEHGYRKGKGLTGAEMASAIEKLIKKRKASVNFVRAGWKPAIKTLEGYLRRTGEFKWARRGRPGEIKPDPKTMSKRVPDSFGKAIIAPVTKEGRAYGEIQNNVIGNGENSLLQIKEEGLQKAVDRETVSMRQYIENKMNVIHKEFNRKQST